MVSPSPAAVVRAPAGPRSRLQWTPQPVPRAAPQNFIGAMFADRYLLRRRIGAGGMSTVYEAQDTTLGSRVMVKILRDDLPGDPVDRFRREAHVLAGLTHEHIARIIDRRDPEEGPRFLVTDFIDGQDLSELRRGGPVPPAVVVQIGLQVAAALAYAHEAGVIHRDLKPSNLMLVRHPGGDIFVKVIDFGIAKLAQDSDLAAPGAAPPSARRATRGDVVVLGTAPYWCDREGPQADVYALAFTLAVLLTGRVPPDGEQPDLDNHGIPSQLAGALRTALALGDALATMDAFSAALREVSDTLDARQAEVERRRYVARVFPGVRPAALSAGAPALAPQAPRFGERYILSDELGHGGMGRVRIAFDTQLRRRVALKTIHPQYAQRDSFQARLRREARALATIDHPGVPKSFDSGTDPEPYFTMEIVVGVPLKAEKRIEPLRALSLAIDLAEILGAAHEAGIVHRDVKPDNILIGKGDRVRLLDFGVCLFLPRYHQRELLFPATPPGERYETGAMELVGTPGYTAPEILAHEGTTTRSDIYSLCAVLYRMLTGRSLLDPITTTTRPIERGEFPAALEPVAELLRRGTAREPIDRPRNMADVVVALERVRAELLRARERRAVVRAVFLTALVCLSLALALLFGLRPTGHMDVAGGVAPADHGLSVAPMALPALVMPETTEAVVPLMVLVPPRPDAGLLSTNGSAPLGPPPAVEPPTASADPGAVDIPVSKPPRPAIALTETTVNRVLQRHRRRFQACSASYHLLRLVIADGRGALAEVDGMTLAPSVPLHTCLARGLRGLAFPSATKPAEFTLSLDLRPPKEPS